MRSSCKRFKLASHAARKCPGRQSSSQRAALGRNNPPLVAIAKFFG
jgi:hypothetical protein